MDNDCDGSTDCSDSNCLNVATESCNNVNDDCDGSTDEGCDDDGDDYCDSSMTYTISTTCPNGGGDCNDNVAAIRPGATELCDGIDNNCVNGIDEGCSCTNGQTQQCGATDVGECEYGTSTCSGGAWGPCIGEITAVPEVCANGLDEDCDGTPDNGCIVSTCGNNIIESGEDCDDGDTSNGDGCNSSCGFETGWNCVGEPSVCSETCGDGLVVGGEECDGSNLDGEDCASQLGSGYTGTLTCSSCNFNTSGCVAPCDITDGYWNITDVLEGVEVRLILEATSCNGKTINFEVKEDDGIWFDDNVNTEPNPITFGSPNNYGTWTAEWQDDTGLGQDGDPPEYYFIATVQGTSELFTSSKDNDDMLKVQNPGACYLELEGRPISYCSDYDEESACNSDLCSVSFDSILDPNIVCGDNYECSCVWDDSEGICNARWSGTGTTSDFDGDGILNGDDPDWDGDGYLDSPFDTDPNGDLDGDGIINQLDPDYINSDDIDGDGILNGDDPDWDGDGYLDSPYDIDPNGDLDIDTIPNQLDADYINNSDIDGDGILNGDDPDWDGDNVMDGQYFGIDPNGDMDNDGIPNIDDDDMDNDGIKNGDDIDFDNNGSSDGRYSAISSDPNWDIGTCTYVENSEDDCSDGIMIHSLIASWIWSPENIQYFADNGVHLDPLNKMAKCQGIERRLPCSPAAQVSFFGAYQLAIAVAIIGLVYLFYLTRKNTKKKVKSLRSRHKKKARR